VKALSQKSLDYYSSKHKFITIVRRVIIVVSELVLLIASESMPRCSRGMGITLHTGEEEVLVTYFSYSRNHK
jgi:hypothetical protein